MGTKSYREGTRRTSDFRVRYSWLPQTDQTHPQRPFQHMRCDWLYEGEDPGREGISMIWPEFVGEDGHPLHESAVIATSGLACMWIVSPDMRKYHRSRIQVGTRGYFVVGHNRIASAEVVERSFDTDEAD